MKGKEKNFLPKTNNQCSQVSLNERYPDQPAWRCPGEAVQIPPDLPLGGICTPDTLFQLPSYHGLHRPCMHSMHLSDSLGNPRPPRPVENHLVPNHLYPLLGRGGIAFKLVTFSLYLDWLPDEFWSSGRKAPRCPLLEATPASLPVRTLARQSSFLQLFPRWTTHTLGLEVRQMTCTPKSLLL